MIEYHYILFRTVVSHVHPIPTAISSSVLLLTVDVKLIFHKTSIQCMYCLDQCFLVSSTKLSSWLFSTLYSFTTVNGCEFPPKFVISNQQLQKCYKIMSTLLFDSIYKETKLDNRLGYARTCIRIGDNIKETDIDTYPIYS